jgi:hypothetical protein
LGSLEALGAGGAAAGSGGAVGSDVDGEELVVEAGADVGLALPAAGAEIIVWPFALTRILVVEMIVPSARFVVLVVRILPWPSCCSLDVLNEPLARAPAAKGEGAPPLIEMAVTATLAGTFPKSAAGIVLPSDKTSLYALTSAGVAPRTSILGTAATPLSTSTLFSPTGCPPDVTIV